MAALRQRLAELRGPGTTPRPLDARALAALAANPGCRRRALLDGAGVDKTALARALGAPAPFGRSEFAFVRGNAFEARIRADGGAELIRLVHGRLGGGEPPEPGEVRVPDLAAPGPEGRAARTRAALAEAFAAGAWTLMFHPMVRLEVAGSPVFLEPDAVVVHPDGVCTVVEVKSFPVLDGSADAAKVGAAARQAAVYVLALRDAASAAMAEAVTAEAATAEAATTAAPGPAPDAGPVGPVGPVEGDAGTAAPATRNPAPAAGGPVAPRSAEAQHPAQEQDPAEAQDPGQAQAPAEAEQHRPAQAQDPAREHGPAGAAAPVPPDAPAPAGPEAGARVRSTVLLVCPRDFSNLPTAEPVDIRKQLAVTRRQLERMTRLEEIAAALPEDTTFDLRLTDDGRTPTRPAGELAAAVDTVPPAYAPDCLAACELAFHCRSQARGSGAVEALGRGARGELGGLTTVAGALGAARGETGDPSDPAVAALRRAAALRAEALATAGTAGGAGCR
ncbi:hypothetical protein HCK00_18560 [Streptomyces sp. PLAI1-29]|uniref:Secreted protein n=1 Tax=Streptomyces zingiberis TaxID=2053010 RepID=A0ABX1BXR6_9ACTN|nr:hypothetical protein [Streptomyces zingiberis]